MKPSHDILTAFLLFLLPIAATAEASRLQELLEGYLANDTGFRKAAIAAEAAALSLESAQISNGLTLTISSGTITVAPSSNGTRISLSPSVEASAPMLNDSAASLSVPITVQDEETEINNASLSLSTGIITGTAKQKRISVLEAERKYTEAKRSAQNAAVTAERGFYTGLKKLYGYAVTVLSRRSDLYDADVALRKLKAQGYSTSSSSYIRADLKVRSSSREVSEAERVFTRETAAFAAKCGTHLSLTDDAYKAAMAFLPSDIPEADLLDPASFSKEHYLAIESAVWSKYIASLKREAAYDLTLKANAGYTFNNSSVRSDSVDAGLSLSWRGLSARAGVSVPTGGTVLPNRFTGDPSSDPVLTLLFSFAPSTWRLSRLEARQDALNARLEDIAIESATNDYESDMASRLTTMSDLRWEKESYQEEYELCAQLEQSTALWYRQGIVSQSDLNDAKDNLEKARINLLICAIDVIVFNDETRLLFCEDIE